MSMVVNILLFLLLFGILVVVHEGGHFLVARANGIRVREFSVGFGPRIFHKKRHGTIYSIKLLPFGGACIFDGMPGFEEEEEEEAEAETERRGLPRFLQDVMPEEEEDQPQGIPFREAKVWARIATIFAGPLFNFLLAFLAALLVTALSRWDYPVINGFTEESAAQEAGLREGDLIIRMNGESIHMGSEASMLSQFNRGETIRMVVERDGEQIDVDITPAYSEADDRYYMGVFIGKPGEVRGAQIIPYAWYSMRYYVKWTYRALGMLVTGRLGTDALSGPVGIVQMVGETYEVSRSFGFQAVLVSMMELLLLLSVNLAIMNLLPIPALDGGRLVLLFIEVIRGKPIPPEKEGYVTLAGAIFLVALMVFVLFNDVVRFIR